MTATTTTMPTTVPTTRNACKAMLRDHNCLGGMSGDKLADLQIACQMLIDGPPTKASKPAKAAKVKASKATPTAKPLTRAECVALLKAGDYYHGLSKANVTTLRDNVRMMQATPTNEAIRAKSTATIAKHANDHATDTPTVATVTASRKAKRRAEQAAVELAVSVKARKAANQTARLDHLAAKQASKARKARKAARMVQLLAMEAAIESKPAKASKPAKPAKVAKVAKVDDTARCPINGARLSARQIAAGAKWLAILATGTVQGRKTTVTRDDYVSIMTERSTFNARAFVPAGWLVGDATGEIRPATCNTMHLASMRAGYSVAHKGIKRGGVIVATKLSAKMAAKQLDNYRAGVPAYRAQMAIRRDAKPAVSASALASRTTPVDDKRVAGFVSALKLARGNRAKSTVLTLTAMDLATATVPASWATGRKDYSDPLHLKARTLAEAGYTAVASRGQLVCSPIVAVAKSKSKSKSNKAA